MLKVVLRREFRRSTTLNLHLLIKINALCNHFSSVIQEFRKITASLI